eukprot:Ihof_evm4s67 gene=Ihof_evmTU4s67
MNTSCNGTPSQHVYMGQDGRRTIFTAGRPPWYDVTGEIAEPIIIGICGGSSSGKTSVAQAIIEEVGVRWVVLMSLDSFYKPLTDEQREMAERTEFNFDHPDTFDFDRCYKVLKRLKEGNNVEIPMYDFNKHSSNSQSQTMYGANVIIFEGIMAFHTPELRNLMDMKIFVDADADIRLARRLQKDVTERGRDLKEVIKQYNSFVKPAFDEFIYPTMKYADVVAPKGADSYAAIDLIVKRVQLKLNERGVNYREQLLQQTQDETMPQTLHVLPATKQLRGLHTIIRNKMCKREKFIFYSQRLMRLALEYCLSLMPYEPRKVITPRDKEFCGLRKSAPVCGVSVVRAGVAMEGPLREVCKDIPLGKILIQTDPSTGIPALHYYSLPNDLKKYHIILLDTTIATGAAAI